jgi:molybdopterin/thiamine biosynthesis adenylyltransferase
VRTFTELPKHEVAVYKSKPIETTGLSERGVHSSQIEIRGFNQGKIHDTRVLVVGGGGLGGEVGHGLARKGFREIHIFDPDFVEPSNLNRQFFFPEDFYEDKAPRLVRNLIVHATAECTMAGYPWRIQEAYEMGCVPDCDVAIVLVDNESGRIFCSKFFRHIPIIFSAVSIECDRLYVTIQQCGKACYRCVVPEPDVPKHRCHLPSCIDVNKVAAGLVLFAVDSLIMNRARSWNYKEVSLTGILPDRTEYIERKPDCPLCTTTL